MHYQYTSLVDKVGKEVRSDYIELVIQMAPKYAEGLGPKEYLIEKERENKKKESEKLEKEKEQQKERRPRKTRPEWMLTRPVMHETT